MRRLLNVKLGIKIFGGFGILIILLAIISTAGLVSLSMIVDRWQKSDIADEMVKVILESRRHEKNYIIRNDPSYVKKVDDLAAGFRAKAQSASGLMSSPEEKKGLETASGELEKYIKAFHSYVANKTQQDAALKEMDEKAFELGKMMDGLIAATKTSLDGLMKGEGGENAQAVAETKQLLEDANEIQKLFLEAHGYQKEFVATADPEQRAMLQARMDKLLSICRGIQARADDDKIVAQVDSLSGGAQDYFQRFIKCAAWVAQKKQADDEMVRAARAIQAVCDQARLTYSAEMSRNIHHARYIIAIVSGLALLLGLVLATFLTRAITRPLSMVIDGLSNGAEQVTGASGMISSTSQRLAEGASEQAAAIEQTSSAIEQMASMTRQNAQNADQANSLMAETRDTVSAAGESMSELMESMTEISKASEQTSKIVKTIDEIAFQTNLLALNAAVEAARAGEAGAGFAVVADEVRNLAMRAAEAARNTSDLIQTTVLKINGGSAVLGKTSQGFSRVVGGAVKMADLVSEIASASNEQAQGIEQISKAIGEMDKVVQQNAADAEESAAASEEMSAQAEQMKVFVDGLEVMIRGGGQDKKVRSAGDFVKALPAVASKRTGSKKAKPEQARSSGNGAGRPQEGDGRLSPEKVIPFDEKDFDF